MAAQEGPSAGKRTGLQTAGAVDRADADGRGREHGHSLAPPGRAAKCRAFCGGAGTLPQHPRPPVSLVPGRSGARPVRLDLGEYAVEAGPGLIAELEGARLGAQRRDSRLEAVEQRLRALRLPAVMRRRVEPVALPDLPEVRARVGPGEVIAARPDGLDLVERQGFVVGGQRRHERLRVADQMVAEHDGFVAAPVSYTHLRAHETRHD